MKKIIVKSLALAICFVIIASAPVAASAETSYTYLYDYWEEYQECPDAYTVASVITATDLGLEKGFKNPGGIYVHDGLIYVLDSGNNRILVLKRDSVEKLEVVDIIDHFYGWVEKLTFSNPTDIAISEQGNIFIADKDNGRILKLDSKLNLIRVFKVPADKSLDINTAFAPSKIVVDGAERVYCIATGINQGLIKYESDGTFSGFVGATPVSYNLWDYFWKKFSSKEQRAKMESFVPTEYSNIYMDHEGFIYAVIGSVTEEDIRDDGIEVVRKLNMLGNDILVRNGEVPVIGDIYMGSGGGYSGPSQFSDITVFENDSYICLDRNRGRLFGYNDQGRLLFAFGGNGNMNGYFRRPVGLANLGYDLYVLDELDCAITIFTPTEFGKAIYAAIDSFDNGQYEKSGDYWQDVMDIDGNYELAYIGIGRSLLRQKQYGEAMDYFKMKYDPENWSKAYKQYRKEWVEDNIGIFVLILVLLFGIPLGIGKVKAIKREIDTADIFQ